MSPLCLLPAHHSLPGKGVPCLYLFAGPERVKIGRSANLVSRAKSGEFHGMTCVAFVAFPHSVDLNALERTLIHRFASLPPARRCRSEEWRLADKGEAYALFEDVTLELLEGH